MNMYVVTLSRWAIGDDEGAIRWSYVMAETEEEALHKVARTWSDLDLSTGVNLDLQIARLAGPRHQVRVQERPRYEFDLGLGFGEVSLSDSLGGTP